MGLIKDVSETDRFKLIAAARDNDIETVKHLTSKNDFKDENGTALQVAVREGHKQCVELLIPVSDPKADDSEALRVAASKGDKDIVQMLIPVSDPKAFDSWAMRIAINDGDKECAELLYNHSDIEVVRNFSVGNRSKNLLDEIESDIQRKSLSEAIGLDVLTEQAPVKKRRM